MPYLAKEFRLGLLGLLTATAFGVSTPAIAAPIALSWEPVCFNEGLDEAEKGEAGVLCVAIGIEDGGGTPAPYDTPVEFEVTLAGMQHIELFPTEPIDTVPEEENIAIGLLGFAYEGMDGDNINIAGYLSDENGEEIPDTSFYGSVNTNDAPLIDFLVPIQGCEAEGNLCSVLLFAGVEEPRDFAGVTFHDIHFAVIASMADCEAPCVGEPLFDPQFAFFINGLALLEEEFLPVGTVGDWASVPEPTTLLLLGLGLAGLGFAKRRLH